MSDAEKLTFSPMLTLTTEVSIMQIEKLKAEDFSTDKESSKGYVLVRHQPGMPLHLLVLAAQANKKSMLTPMSTIPPDSKY